MNRASSSLTDYATKRYKIFKVHDKILISLTEEFCSNSAYQFKFQVLLKSKFLGLFEPSFMQSQYEYSSLSLRSKYSVVHKNVTVLLSTSLAWPAWAGYDWAELNLNLLLTMNQFLQNSSKNFQKSPRNSPKILKNV